jgi:hypothetical protein
MKIPHQNANVGPLMQKKTNAHCAQFNTLNALNFVMLVGDTYQINMQIAKEEEEEEEEVNHCTASVLMSVVGNLERFGGCSHSYFRRAFNLRRN